MPLLAAENLHKTYDTGEARVTALAGVSFTIARGAFVALMGPSGCGKSTLLHLCGAMDRPSVGTIRLNDRDLSTLSDDELTRAIIGAIGSLDAYQLPDAKGYTSLVRYLTGETDEHLQQYRDELLSTTTADFHALAGVLEQINDAGDVVVLGSREALEAANGEGLGLEITKVM